MIRYYRCHDSTTIICTLNNLCETYEQLWIFSLSEISSIISTTSHNCHAWVLVCQLSEIVRSKAVTFSHGSCWWLGYTAKLETNFHGDYTMNAVKYLWNSTKDLPWNYYRYILCKGNTCSIVNKIRSPYNFWDSFTCGHGDHHPTLLKL